jgi:hypothetical protein
MNIVRNAVLSVAVAATTLSAMPMAAEAGERWRHHDRRPVVVQRHNDTGALVAAGILGLAVGAIAAGVVSQPQPVYSDRYHYPRPRHEREYFPPAPGYRDYGYDRYASAYEPWSPEWYRYCSRRYRSFDPSTGTYTLRPGVQRFCVAE